jgi:hypothetical protein
MPRGDGTGPMGMGAGTSRGRGNCASDIRRGLGVALGIGLGMGLKRGFRHFWRANQGTSDELNDLKSQQQALEEGLSKIKERISELEQDK